MLDMILGKSNIVKQSDDVCKIVKKICRWEYRTDGIYKIT